ncbi:MULTISPECIES: hypothetical protein [unclassified Cupriavidus]|uniref:hypothetical protein n=1 Tax=Cupriavidus sp. H19C3 TaxID=3241603 RepID=UPI003BF8E84D
MLSTAQRWVRLAETTDAALLDDWLAMLRPLPVPEARARRLALAALLAQGGQGLAVMAGTDAVQALMPATLVHDLSHAGRVAMVADWWCAESAALPAASVAPDRSPAPPGWFACCANLLADWCRAHGIRHLLIAPALIPDAARTDAYQRDPSGLWRRDCMPAPKALV